MQIEQLVLELRGRQHIPLDAALRADEERLDAGSSRTQRARDRQPGIEVSASSSAGENDSHRATQRLQRERAGRSAARPDDFFACAADVDENSRHQTAREPDSIGRRK